MDPLIREFLTKWLAWAKAGGVTEEFARYNGLCTNLKFWAGYKTDSCLHEKFTTLLAYYFGKNRRPFNEHPIYYFEETLNETTHLNPKRLAWVEKVLKGE